MLTAESVQSTHEINYKLLVIFATILWKLNFLLTAFILDIFPYWWNITFSKDFL